MEVSMELNYFWEFCILSQTKNYSETADRLFLSEPTLSRHIKAMEAELGVPLFTRGRNSIELTRYGKEILPFANSLIQTRNDLNYHLNEIKFSETQTTNIISTYSLHEFMDQMKLHDIKAKANVTYYNGKSEQVLEMLREGQYELAVLCDYKPVNEDFTFIPFLTDYYAVVMSEKHPLSARESVSLADLRHEDFILFSQEHDCSNDILDLCKNAGFTPNVICTANSGKQIASFVQYGGVSILKEKSIHYNHNENEPVSIVRLTPSVPIEISLCFTNGHSLSETAQTIIKFVTNTWPDIRKTDEGEP